MRKNRWRIGVGAAILAASFFVAPLRADAAGGVKISKNTFPDKAFRSYVSENVDANSDGVLSAKEIKKTTNMFLRHLDIKSLKGIEYFTELTDIDLRGNKLTTVDFSKNKKLEGLDLGSNKLKSLDVTGNTELKSLYLRGNALKSMDISKNTKLEFFDMLGTKVQTIDISKNVNLTYFGCDVAKLDTKKNPKLEELVVRDGGLTSLDLSMNPELEYLAASGNKIKTLDISKNPKLVKAYNYGVTYRDKKMGTLSYGKAPSGLEVDKSVKIIADGRWKKADGKWYFIKTDGKKQTGWKKIAGKWYYFKTKTGIMASDEYINGYRLEKSGVWKYKAKASWKKTKKGWKYSDKKGWYAKNQTLSINGKKYTFDKNGYMK